ncbi:hypothetical protein XENORESO_002326 [Xenotaenia resolanae]|uniref:Uncharacterized protein n=1 Tax=Xenotaenia resolanae TaxID=208358 RepID=A0ABV0X3A5_9TELE
MATLITVWVKSFAFQRAVYFLDKTQCSNPLCGPLLTQPEHNAPHHRHKMANRAQTPEPEPLEAKADFIRIIVCGRIFCTGHAECGEGLCAVCSFSYHQHVSEIFFILLFCFYLGLVAHRSLRRGKSVIHILFDITVYSLHFNTHTVHPPQTNPHFSVFLSPTSAGVFSDLI